MLRGIYKASSNWIGRTVMGLVLGLIAVSFGIWGIGDIFRGFGQSTLAKVGNTEIQIEAFRQIYQDRLRQISQQIGRPIPAEQARALGLDRQVLGQTIAENALDQRARQLRLGLADAEIARRVAEDPNFKGLTGQFDRSRFEQIIRQIGFTESRYLADQRRGALRQQLVGTIGGELPVPKTAMDALNRFQNEQRSIEFVQLGSAQAGDVPDPAPDVLTRYFEERKVVFRAPEYRKVQVMVMTPAEVAATIEVSDADLKAAYQQRQAAYTTPERRHILQIPFPSIEEARAAADKIAKGTSFEAVATERGMKDSDMDLGTVAKTAMVDSAVANAAFVLKEGEVSAPIEGRFGVVLVRVAKVEPGQTKTFEEVAPELKRQMATDRARSQMLDLRDKVEDERLSDANLAEAAKKLNLKLRTIDAIDRQGKTPDGTLVADLPTGVDVLSAAFGSELNGDNDPLQIPGNGGYVWFQVTSITPARDRPLEEVKDQVVTRWRDEEIAKRLKTKSAELVDKLKGGASFVDLATADNIKVQTGTGLKRNAPQPMIPATAMQEIFRTAKGAAAAADGATQTDRIVFRVIDITTPVLDPDNESVKRLDEVLRRAIGEDLTSQYLDAVEKEIGFSINQEALNQVTGRRLELSAIMQIEPSPQTFAARYARNEAQVVWTTLVADLETPVSAFLKIARGRPMSFLLESVEGGAVRGRYSIIGLDPDLIWRTVGQRAEINRAARTASGFMPCPQPPLEALRALIAESRIDLPDGLPPMAAGVFGYLGYDMVRLMEELPAPNPDPIGIPDAVLIRPTLVVVFDAVKDSITVVTPVRPEPGVAADVALARAQDRLAAVVDALDRPLDKAQATSDAGPVDVAAKSNTAPADYGAMVRKAKDYIMAGDVFQVVLSQRFEAPFALPPLSLYRALRRVNPAPFLYFLDFGGFAIAGSSPEVLVRLRDNTVTIRPLAGTRPRGETPALDKKLEEELLADPKERAEHLMLLDLGRNDVGRVSKIGTVAVTDQFFIERYSHVMHIVSNVEGTLAEGRDALDALAAGFPAGTVSGAPKVRAMEIIDELEKHKRGLYAGAVGYFSAAGEMDSCIVLRTALIKDGTMYVQAGAGIVADSDPDKEQTECVNKAKALFRAAEEARRFASAGRRGQ